MITICKNAKTYAVFQMSGETEGVAFVVAPALKITCIKRKTYSYYTHLSKDKSCLVKWTQEISFEKPTHVAKFYVKTE